MKSFFYTLVFILASINLNYGQTNVIPNLDNSAWKFIYRQEGNTYLEAAEFPNNTATPLISNISYKNEQNSDITDIAGNKIAYRGGRIYEPSKNWALQLHSMQFPVNEDDTWTFTAVIAGRCLGDMSVYHPTKDAGAWLGFITYNVNDVEDYTPSGILMTYNITEINEPAMALNGTFGWRKVSVTYKIPHGITGISPLIWSWELSGGGEIYVHSVSLRKAGNADESLTVPDAPIPSSPINIPAIYHPESAKYNSSSNSTALSLNGWWAAGHSHQVAAIRPLVQSEYVAETTDKPKYIAVRDYNITTTSSTGTTGIASGNNEEDIAIAPTNINTVKVFPGQTWTFSAIVAGRCINDMTSNPDLGLVASIITVKDGIVQNWNAASSTIIRGTFGWKVISTTYTIPEGSDITHLSVRIFARGGGEVYVHDASMLPMNKVNPTFKALDNITYPSSPINIQPELTHTTDPAQAQIHSNPYEKWTLQNYEPNITPPTTTTTAPGFLQVSNMGGVEHIILTMNPDGVGPRWNFFCKEKIENNTPQKYEVNPAVSYTFLVDAMGMGLLKSADVGGNAWAELGEIFKIEIKQYDNNGNAITVSPLTTTISSNSASGTQKWIGADGYYNWQRFTVDCSGLNANTKYVSILFSGDKHSGRIYLANMRLLPINNSYANSIYPTDPSNLTAITLPSISASDNPWQALPSYWKATFDFPIGSYANTETSVNSDGTTSTYIGVRAYNDSYWELKQQDGGALLMNVMPNQKWKMTALVSTKQIGVLMNNKIGFGYRALHIYGAPMCSNQHALWGNGGTEWPCNADGKPGHQKQNGVFVNNATSTQCTATNFFCRTTTADTSDFKPNLSLNNSGEWQLVTFEFTIPTKPTDGNGNGFCNTSNIFKIEPFFYGYGGQFFLQWASLTPMVTTGSPPVSTTIFNSPTYSSQQLANMKIPEVGPRINIGSTNERHASERENTIYLEIQTEPVGQSNDENTANVKNGLYNNGSTIQWHITPVKTENQTWQLANKTLTLHFKITDGENNIVNEGTINGQQLSASTLGQGIIQVTGSAPSPTAGLNLTGPNGAYNYVLAYTPPSNTTGYYKLHVWSENYSYEGVHYNLIGSCGAALDLPTSEQIGDPNTGTDIIEDVPFGIEGSPDRFQKRLGLGWQRPLTYNIENGSHTEMPTNLSGYTNKWEKRFTLPFEPVADWDIDVTKPNYAGAVELFNEPRVEGALADGNSSTGSFPNNEKQSAVNFNNMIIASRNGIPKERKVMLCLESPWVFGALNHPNVAPTHPLTKTPYSNKNLLWNAYDIMSIHPYSMIIFEGVSKCPEYSGDKSLLYDFDGNLVLDDAGQPIIKYYSMGPYSLLQDLESYRDANVCNNCGTETIAPKKEIWTTEYGWDSPFYNTIGGISELKHAQYTVRGAMLQIAIAGVKKLMPYTWSDQSYSAGGGGGLFRVDNKPKATVQAYSIMAKIINKIPYKGYRDYGTESNIGCLAFQGDNKTVLVVWTPSNDTKTITITSSPDKIYDMFGKSITPTTSISLTQSPKYIVFNNAGLTLETLLGCNSSDIHNYMRKEIFSIQE